MLNNSSRVAPPTWSTDTQTLFKSTPSISNRHRGKNYVYIDILVRSTNLGEVIFFLFSWTKGRKKRDPYLIRLGELHAPSRFVCPAKINQQQTCNQFVYIPSPFLPGRLVATHDGHSNRAGQGKRE